MTKKQIINEVKKLTQEHINQLEAEIAEYCALNKFVFGNRNFVGIRSHAYTTKETTQILLKKILEPEYWSELNTSCVILDSEIQKLKKQNIKYRRKELTAWIEECKDNVKKYEKELKGLN